MTPEKLREWAEDHGYLNYRCKSHGPFSSDSGPHCPQCEPEGDPPDDTETIMEHTPGPWFQDDENPEDVYTRAGELIVAAYPLNNGNKLEQYANARLISAAPEMLDSIKILWKWFDQHADGAPDAAQWQKEALRIAGQLHKTIDKAEGK